MANILNRIKQIIDRFKNLIHVGSANLTVNAISGIFWFFIAKLLGEDGYGEVSYFIAIAHIAGVFSMIGASDTMTVYTAKGIKIEPPLYLLTTISSLIASVILFYLFLQEFSKCSENQRWNFLYSNLA